jgi:murein L,D-transpeptidase YcbB/YkuD
MGASRSASVAIAALLAGWAGHPLPLRAQVAAEVTSTAPSAPDPVVQTDAIAPAAQPMAQDASAPPEASAPKAEVPPSPTETTVAAPPVPAPADPLAAAVAARLADPAPLLPRLTTKDREAMQAFYALGAFRPVWVQDGALTPAAKSAAARLARAGEDGLDPASYPVPVLGVVKPSEADVAAADLKFSAAVALYARDARGGRINPANLSRLITPTLDLPPADVVLGRIASAGPEAGDLLQRYNPSQPGYLALKARLNRNEAPVTEAAALRLPDGPVLKPGMRDPRVPLLRAHFSLETRTAGTLDAPPGEPEAYDDAVVAAVKAFQRRRGLPATGNLTAPTVVALAAPETAHRREESDGTLLVNMERWRWLPADLGRDYVLVNIPEFRLRVVRDGRQRDETRVIVGKTESPTPIFSGMMDHAIVNPSWNVPPSILKNEFLPALARDPSYAARKGYEVVYRNGNISVRQPPGERNALGFIKFMFPNNHAVYLHDTPNRSLFSASQRALSHGCVRVDDPFRFADSVLPDEWSSERLKKMIGKGERTIRLSEKLPVHLAYFTATTDELGGYRTLPDLYGHDARMKAALGLPGGAAALAKLPPEPKRKPVRIVRPAPDPLRTAASRAPAEAYAEPNPWFPREARQSRGWW